MYKCILKHFIFRVLALGTLVWLLIHFVLVVAGLLYIENRLYSNFFAKAPVDVTFFLKLKGMYPV